VATVACAIGLGTAALYHTWGLTLSHYDAKAHLVVARRILDSMRPGWMQIGAVWLPLPHLLNVVPVQSDALYQTGLSAVAFSVAAFTIGATALWQLVRKATGSVVAAAAGFLVFVTQPDVLYLQSTPMTEPLLMGLCLFGVYRTWEWVHARGAGRTVAPGLAFALACLTRYEAWPVAAAAVLIAPAALVRMGVPPPVAMRKAAAFACYPAAAIAAFMWLSHLTIGQWLVTSGFYEIDGSIHQKPLAVLEVVWTGVMRVNGPLVSVTALAALVMLLRRAWQVRDASHLLAVLPLLACLTLPLYAFWHGHPFRSRYMVPSTMAVAAMAGVGVGLLPRYRRVAAAIIAATALIEVPPFSQHAPMLVEAQRDAGLVRGRQELTACWMEHDDETPILASMGSLAHYMQETSHAGLQLRRFIHEGIGDLWADSLADAGRHAGWILIEEQAEGGDAIARITRSDSAFLARFERQCEGGGVGLYRRQQADHTIAAGGSGAS
jgi:hypothetical protein